MVGNEHARSLQLDNASRLRNHNGMFKSLKPALAMAQILQRAIHASIMGPAVNMDGDVELAELPSNQLRQRRRTTPSVASRPFAGRIGGNQEFTADPDESIAKKLPDAAPNFSWKQSFNYSSFTDVELWKEATIEGVGTCLQLYLSGLYSIGLGPAATETGLGPITPTIIGSLANFLLISLFIFAGGPVSGE